MKRSLFLLLAACSISTAAAAPFVVNSTGDQIDFSTADGVCDVDNVTAGDQCTLRAAIQQANFTAGTDTISFNLGAGTPLLTVATELPAIAQPVMIDGATGGATRVQVRAAAFGITNGLRVTGGGSTIKSLVIGNFLASSVGAGILLETAGGNTIIDCFIGTNPAGTSRDENRIGIWIRDVPNNTIGGTTAGAGNLISGNSVNFSGGNLQISGANATGNVILGNLIGTTASGAAAIGPSQGDCVVILGADNNTVGGTVAGSRNIISGSGGAGIRLDAVSGDGASGNQIQGNYIGTDVNGTAAIPNSVGIDIAGSPGNFIGGTTPGAGNLISGNNGSGGIRMTFSQAANNTIQGNLIGTDASGTAALPNNGGIVILSAPGTVIGGNTAGARNIISSNGGNGITILGSGGNAIGTVIQGNYIGTDITGSADLGNTQWGISNEGGSRTQIGGRSAGARNVISGNGSFGLQMSNNRPPPDNDVVEGNYIGLAADGSSVLGNSSSGIFVSGTDALIGGTAAGAGNVISGNGRHGVELSESDNDRNFVQGNLIGTDSTGTLDRGNTLDGVAMAANAANTMVGGTTAGARNIISGNDRHGVSFGAVSFAPFSGNVVAGNFIGTQIDGVSALGNALDGVNSTTDGSSGAFNTIGGTDAGAGNVIAFNGRAGVAILTGTGGNTHIAILGNSIFANTALGIDLSLTATPDGVTPNDTLDPDIGPNGLQNFPLISSATSAGGNTSIAGSLNSLPNRDFRIEFFSSPAADPSGSGEGQTFLGAANVRTDDEGNASIGATLPGALPAGAIVSATASRLLPAGSRAAGIDGAISVPADDTSEFSASVPAGGGQPTVQFSSATYSVGEGDGVATLTVTRTGDTSGESSVHYATSNGTATAGSDYAETSGDLVFGPTETSKTFTVTIIDDTTSEGGETFTVLLSVPNGAALGSPSTATVTIVENDAEPTPSPSPSPSPNPTPNPTPAAVQLSNISGRAFGQLNDRVSICGFIITGGGGKEVIVRGIGPSLGTGNPPVAGALQDPMIQLYDGNGVLLSTNDNWRGPQEAEIQATGLAPNDNREAAILSTLMAGSYTTILRGANNSAGIGLVEVYDLEPFDGELANVSVRGVVLTDDNVLITGLILRGALPKRILFRAIGPDLRRRGITDELQDPTLAVHDQNGALLGSNDNWRDAPNALEIQASGIPPADDRESAVLMTLSPANYTAIVRGVDRTTGVALAEAYKLDDAPAAKR